MSAVANLPEISIRPMVHADLDAVIAIEKSAYGFPWSRNVFRDCLRAGYVCRVAERPEGIELSSSTPVRDAASYAPLSGFALMSIGAEEAHILNLCVDPDYHRCGIGHALLNEMVGVAVDMDVRTTYLEVRTSNDAARGLYAIYGFSEIGIRDGYYPATYGREDAIVLALNLAERES